jgi:FtsP/CotA-like multicopper oxidase with cupredoxin domain
MTSRTVCPTRRQFGQGFGATLALLAASHDARTQTAAGTPQKPVLPSLPDVADGYRLLRPKAGMAALRGPDQPPTVIHGYDGATPGPQIRRRQGEELKARLVNGLPDPTTIHWHGIRLPAAMDGTPNISQPPVSPGQSFDYRFTLPDAGTFWYRAPQDPAHPAGRGLYGALIVDERVKPDVDRDILLMIDDWWLGPDGAIGREGTHLTVNGVPAFDIAVRANERVRLRLVNASAGRPVALRLDRHRAIVMAIDGQPAQPFTASAGRVVLGPGNRIDLFVDMTMQPGEAAPLVAESHRDKTIARLVYEPGAPARAAVRDEAPPLPDNPLPQKMDFAGAQRVDYAVDAAPNGNAAQPLFSVKRGRTVMLAFDNRSDLNHVVHLHGHSFRLLDRLDDGWKPFWLDTLALPPRQIWRVAFVADNPGKWILEDRMIGGAGTTVTPWFAVT